MNQEENIKYDMYLRKSSEAEDKQVQSIDDQRRELKEYAVKNSLNIVGEFEESQSAHQLGRPVFSEVIKRLGKGTANALLVWHPNRLSRNPIDGGAIINLLDQGKLIHVRTPSHIYGNTSTEKMMLALEFMISKKDSDDKSDAVKRGLRGRYKKGYPNGVAPIGFLNDMSGEKGNRGWTVDKEKLPLVRQLLELCLTGEYSTRALLGVANDDFGLRTPQHKKQGGKKLVLSYLTGTVLKNTVYAGFFYDKSGERHELNESIPRIITEDQHEQILKIIGDRCRVRPWKNKMMFAYTGPTKCGACGGSVTAEHKYQVICDCKLKFAYLSKTHCPRCNIAINKMKHPNYLHYIHYHCVRKKDPNCKEGSVQECRISDFLADYYKENFKISKALHDWCMENIKTLDMADAKDGSEKKISIESTLGKKQKEYKELILMKTRGLIGDDEFLELKASQKSEIDALQRALSNNGGNDQVATIRAQRAFTLALGIEHIFKNGTVQEKKETLSELGSNLTLKEKKLSVCNTGVYKIIIDGLLTAKAKNSGFEPENIQDTSSLNDVFSYQYKPLLALVDDFRTIDWVNEYPFPSIALQEIKSLLVT